MMETDELGRGKAVAIVELNRRGGKPTANESDGGIGRNK